MVSRNGTRPVFPGMEERWAQVSGGRLRYLVGGTGPPLVLVHGIAASSFSFRLSCERLMRRSRIFVPDLMNVGYSDRIPGLAGSLHAVAARMVEFLDQVELKQADILGSSHGGSVVMELGALALERFRRMVLVSPANPFAARYETIIRFYLSAVGGLFVRACPFMPGWMWDYGIGRMYANPSRMPPGTGIGYARPLRQPGTIPYILECLKTFGDDIEALLPKLPRIAKVPTLIIWGDRDPVVEIQSGYRLQQALGAEMAVIAGAGHLPYEETPVEFDRILLDYLQMPVRSPRPAGDQRSASID
jgi:pimeloyl-ACP methyl ester carboxylesterase